MIRESILKSEGKTSFKQKVGESLELRQGISVGTVATVLQIARQWGSVRFLTLLAGDA